LGFKQRLDVHFGQEGNADMRTAPSILKEPAPYKSALLAATISMVKRRIATQSLLFCFDEFEDFFD
jgi:hypothetical protein